MNWQIFKDSLGFYLLASLTVVICSFPFLLVRIKKRKVNVFLVYIFGLINLIFCLFLVANIDHFWMVRKDYLVLMVLGLLLVETFVALKFRSNKGNLEIDNTWRFGVIWLLGLGGFYYLLTYYLDGESGRYFSPGYGINHDYISSLSVIRSFFLINKGEVGPVANYYNLYRGTGYPVGGIYLNAFFVNLFKVDPYWIYQKVLVWLSLSTLFIASYLVYDRMNRKSVFLELGWLIVAPLTVFSYLSIAIINTGTLASTMVVPLVVLAIAWTLVMVIKDKFSSGSLLILGIILTDMVFVYSYFGMVFYGVFLLFLPFVFRVKLSNYIKLGLVVLMVFLWPLNLIKNWTMVGIQLASENPEINLFKGGTFGNTIGFVNPAVAFSLWFSNADYRFSQISEYNLWLFVSFVMSLLVIMLWPKTSQQSRKLALISFIPFAALMELTRWYLKSPYQNVKSMQLFSGIWPIVLYLIAKPGLKEKNFFIRMVTLGWLVVYCFYGYKSAIFASSYIGKPVVESNYELMDKLSDLCEGEGPKLLLGRDEMANYFLLPCREWQTYYDRYGNNQQFWEVIKINNLSSLDAKCEENSLELTEIDYEDYQQVLVDKCFRFENKDFELVKEYEVYDWYKRKDKQI